MHPEINVLHTVKIFNKLIFLFFNETSLIKNYCKNLISNYKHLTMIRNVKKVNINKYNNN